MLVWNSRATVFQKQVLSILQHLLLMMSNSDPCGPLVLYSQWIYNQHQFHVQWKYWEAHFISHCSCEIHVWKGLKKYIVHISEKKILSFFQIRLLCALTASQSKFSSSICLSLRSLCFLCLKHFKVIINIA